MKKKLSIALMSLVLVACLVATICLAGCVKANNAVEKADAAWAKQVSKNGGTATSVINIKDLRLSIGEDGDEYISLDGKITITRKIQGVSSKLNVTISDLAINTPESSSSIVNIAIGNLKTILGLIRIPVDGQWVSAIKDVNVDNIGDVKLSIDIEYNKDYTFVKEDKKGQKGVALVLHSIKLLNANNFIDLYYDVDLDSHEILTAAPEEIDLSILESIDQYKSMITDILGTELDINGMIDDVFFGQTIINMEGDGAEYKSKEYTLKNTSFEKTLSFLLDPIKNNLVSNQEIWSMIKGLELKPVVDASSKLSAILGEFVGTPYAGNKCTVKKMMETDTYNNDTQLKNASVTITENEQEVTMTLDDLLKKIVQENEDATYNSLPAKYKNAINAIEPFDPGLTLGTILDQFDATNPFTKLLGWINFGKMDVTAKMDGKFFGSINSTITGVKVGLSGDDLNSLLGIAMPFLGIEGSLKDFLNNLSGVEFLNLGDLVDEEILQKGLYLTVGNITVANTYTKGI
ncbi:MAG: hypothetical protein K2M44_04305 [Clostridia bacterium]|nr:hypothetical protein [Clostridia bacterium]